MKNQNNIAKIEYHHHRDSETFLRIPKLKSQVHKTNYKIPDSTKRRIIFYETAARQWNFEMNEPFSDIRCDMEPPTKE